MQSRRTTLVSTFVDGLSLKGYLAWAPVICTLLMLTEGIDSFGVGFVGPALSKHYHITAQALAQIYTGTVVASLVGAVVIAPLSDIFGRRRILLLTSLAMAPATLLTPLAGSVPILFALRFIIGLAFGAALPLTLSLTADFAPKRWKGLLLMMMNTGINLGMVLAGLGAASIIPKFGWQALLYASGALSLACTALAWARLPESIQYLVRTDPTGAPLRRLLTRLDPAVKAGALPPVLEPDPLPQMAGTPMALLRDGLAMRTVLFWFLASLTFVMINFSSYWLPTLLMKEGASITQTGLIVSAGKTGGIICAIVIGWLSARGGLSRVITACLIGSAVTASLAGLVGQPLVAVGLVMATACLTSPSVSGSQALTASAYSASLRSTATGWVTGLARLIGGGAGTMVGGYMIGAGWTRTEIGPAIGAVLLAAGLVVLLVTRGERDRAKPRLTSAAEPAAIA